MSKSYLALGLAIAAGVGVSTSAQAGGLTAYGEARLGYETPTISSGSVYKLGNSASIGVEGGVGFALSPKTTLGAFVNYDKSEAKTCEGSVCLGSDGNVAYGARLEYRASEKVRIYGKLGGDSFKLQASVGTATGSQTLSGVMGALGLTYDLGAHAYVGAEMNYADLGSFGGANFQRRHVAITGGVRF